MNEDEKQDKIPEVWEGHNIADYIDPDIMKVGAASTPGSQRTPRLLAVRELTPLGFPSHRNCKTWRGRRS